MEALIRDLLAYSRVIRPQGDELNERADLNTSLMQAFSLMKTRIEESGTRVTHEALPVVIGDESQFTHVFLNLLSNSRKYCRTGHAAEIHIQAERVNTNGSYPLAITASALRCNTPSVSSDSSSVSTGTHIRAQDWA